MRKLYQRRADNPERKRGKRTQGSETSQYLEENRLISIPVVAASETEGAQTHNLARGDGGCKVTM